MNVKINFSGTNIASIHFDKWIKQFFELFYEAFIYFALLIFIVQMYAKIFWLILCIVTSNRYIRRQDTIINLVTYNSTRGIKHFRVASSPPTRLNLISKLKLQTIFCVPFEYHIVAILAAIELLSGSYYRIFILRKGIAKQPQYHFT